MLICIFFNPIEIIKPIEEVKEKAEEKEEVIAVSEATDAAKPKTVKDDDKPETEEKPKEVWT